VPAFTPDAVRSLDGAWGAERLAAAERFAAAAMPTPEEEIWRYSRIDELDLGRFAPASSLTTTVTGADGLLVDDTFEIVEDVLGGDAPDVFAELNRAFMSVIALRIPAGRIVREPVVVTHRVDGLVDGPFPAVFPRLLIDAGADSEVTVVEQFVTGATGVALVAPLTEVRARQAARVRYVGLDRLDAAAWRIAHQRAVGERDATVSLSTVALGGAYSRTRTECRLVGQGASARQTALYFADGDQMHDFRTVQDHAAPRTTSDLLFKGAVQGRSRSVYTGLIRIREGAKGSVADQTNRNLTLSEGAWAESVPNLEIENNDVKCSHASTVGPVDEEQRFYLESRGVPPEVAERLIVLGFFDEVIDQLPVPALADELRHEVARKLLSTARQEATA
jgi:Fe-S cluster assembly protein SufD